MNHLEQLVAEWLQYNDYFVRTSVPVGPRDNGGFEGELDVIAYHFARNHLVHVECSLDALSMPKRQAKFELKFKRGRKYIKDVFRKVSGDLDLPEPEQIVLLQFAGGNVREIGGARLVTVREFINEVYDGLKGKTPQSKSVPSNLPLLRTLQLAADAAKGILTDHRIIRSDRPAPAKNLSVLKSIDKAAGMR
jgi:RNase P/RNase MRP subunit p29